ncbi:hypothetical protein [Fibrella aquatilis]|uniref:Uncharacterized protein n=1 Tax=Fibrella aquatilis TaxID=2817059 RepID=A0A939G6E5_9BACT|nr:hypothetical protein [Fibrella aquatilis]MBO0931230.1 hypothetical protein [Fibrella aquatilis]
MIEQINELIDKVILMQDASMKDYPELMEEYQRHPVPANSDLTKVPTLLPNYYQAISPMLHERFKRFGTWTWGPLGNWLSLEDMENICRDWDKVKPENDYVSWLKAIAENWENDAIRLFRPERISVFAANRDSYERIYLMWFDSMEEPELWIEDSNGVGRFKDFSAFLQWLPVEDISTYEPHWILGYSK